MTARLRKEATRLGMSNTQAKAEDRAQWTKPTDRLKPTQFVGGRGAKSNRRVCTVKGF